jgi:hypothetical protein
MRKFGQFLPVVGLAVATLAGAQPPPPDAAAGVIAAAREALGGEKKLAAVKTVVATGRTRQIRGDDLVPIEFEVDIELPDKYVRKDEIAARESSTISGFNGEILLQFPALGQAPAPAGGPPPPTAEQMAAAGRMRLGAVKQDFARLLLGMFAGSSPALPLTFTYVGKAEAPQGKADVVDVKGPAGPGAMAARLFINADTHLPIMLTWTAPAPPSRGGPPSPPGSPAASGQPPPPAGSPPASAGQGRSQPSPPETRLYFGEYRDVSGLQLPFRVRRALGPDTVEETTFDGYKINVKIDPKKFEVRK